MTIPLPRMEEWTFPFILFFFYLDGSPQRLTNYQVRVLQNVFSYCSTPLFCKLAFMEAIKWRSYFEKEKTFLKRF